MVAGIVGLELNRHQILQTLSCLQNQNTRVIRIEQTQLSNDWKADCLPIRLTKSAANHSRPSKPVIGSGLACILTLGHACNEPWQDPPC